MDSSNHRVLHMPLEDGGGHAYRDAKAGLYRAVEALKLLRSHEVSRPWVYEWLDTAIEDGERVIDALDKEYR